MNRVKTMDSIDVQIDIYVKWAAAHEGHRGNEKADELAKTRTTSTDLLKGYIPKSHIKALVNS